MLTLEKFEEASEVVKKVTNPTKLLYSEYLSEQTGGKIYLKPENMQFTGAYKVRGAYYKYPDRRREKPRTDHGICRKPCAGCGICSTEIRLQGNRGNADSHTTDQG